MKKILVILGNIFVLFALTASAFATDVSKELSKEDIASLEQLKAELTQAATADTYNADYKALVNKFNTKTYMEVLTETKPLIGSVKNQVVYEGKTYDKRAFLHAAIHNLTTRTKSGYGEKDFTITQKLEVMETVYNVFFQYHFHQTDRKFIYEFALNILENSNINRPGSLREALVSAQNDSPFSTADTRQEVARYQENKEKAKKGLVSAIKTLSIISYGEQERTRASDVIYKLVKKLIYSNNLGRYKEQYSEIIDTGTKALYNMHTIHAFEQYEELEKLKNSKLLKVL